MRLMSKGKAGSNTCVSVKTSSKNTKCVSSVSFSRLCQRSSWKIAVSVVLPKYQKWTLKLNYQLTKV